MYQNLSIGFVLNYYWRPTYNEIVRSSAKLAMSMLRSCSIIDQNLLIDGSPRPDDEIHKECQKNNFEYVHLDRELKFAEALNEGWKRLDTDIVGLMASDIYPTSDTINLLAALVAKPGIGSVAPYLDYCDYPGQIASFVRNPITCEPTSMSLNLNLFKKSTLEAIGGIDEQYSGGYNDLILLMKIRKLGQKVVLVGNTRTTHLGRATVSQGTNFNMSVDNPRFSAEYPLYRASHGPWSITHWKWPFATSKRAKLAWWVAQNFPNQKVRRILETLVIWLEPDLTRFKQP